MKKHSAITPQIDQELRQLTESSTLVPLSEVGSVVRAVVKALPWDKIINAQEKTLSESNIASVQKAVQDLDIEAVRDFLMPNVERELAAIVESIHTSTTKILELVEELENMQEVQKNIKAQTVITRIYEACGFQDITGQRMSKIIQLLKKLELRIEGLLGRAGDQAAAERYSKMIMDQKDSNSETEDLMGPNADNLASSQEDIDKIFSDPRD